MIKKNFYFSFTFILLISCLNKPGLKEVKVNDKYILSVPDYLTPCADLNQQASLQLQNLDEDFYLIVIDEEKPVTHKNLYSLESYFKSVIKQPFLK